MRLTRTILGFAAAAAIALTPAYADPGHSSAKPTTIHGQSAADHSTTQSTTTTPVPKKTTTSKPSTHGTKTASKSTTTRVSTNGTTTTTKSQTKTSTKTSRSGSSSTKTSTKTTTTSNTSTSPTTQTKMNPIAAKISAKRNLNTKVSGMLPSGMSLNDASQGFKNQGQFIAALHVSQNLGIPFKDLKNQMVTKSSPTADATQTKSLGQAIQTCKKTSSDKASSEATRAEHQAEHDLDDHDEHHDTRHREESEHHDRDSHKEFGGKHFVKEIEHNRQLNAKVTALLPAGMTLKKAAKGFSSETQFLATLHASKDLGIPFAQLKAEMTGKDHDSLTQAIRELKPGVDARTAVKTALTEARTDIRTTSTQPTNTTGH
jgi:hypothetical protein